MSKKRKILLLLFSIFVVYVTIVFIRLFVMVGSYNARMDTEDKIEEIHQREKIITSLAVSKKGGELQQIAATTLESYHADIVKYCKQQYIFKSDCQLKDLSKENLQALIDNLEKEITKLIDVQNKLQQ